MDVVYQSESHSCVVKHKIMLLKLFIYLFKYNHFVSKSLVLYNFQLVEMINNM